MINFLDSMKTTRRMKDISSGLALLLLGGLLVGCGRKEEAAPPTPAAAAPPPEVVAAPAPTPVPTYSPADTAAAVAERLRQIEAAQKAREYEKAAEAMLQLRMRQQQMNEQQAALVQQRMRTLQADLAAGVASGDPRAIAAANRLRQAASVR